jgi:hypothetical protein
MAQTKAKLTIPKSKDNLFATLLESYDVLLADGMYEVEIKKLTEKKTDKQVKTIFGLLIESVIVKANDDGIDTSSFLKLLVQEDMPTGVGLTKDFLYQLFLVCCPVYDDFGRRITLSKMSVGQAAKFFEDCRNLLASRDIVVPDPDPNWKHKKK